MKSKLDVLYPDKKEKHTVSKLSSQIITPNHYSFSSLQSIGTSWLNKFLPDIKMQQAYVTSAVVKNVIMLQCVYIARIFKDLNRAKQLYY